MNVYSELFICAGNKMVFTNIFATFEQTIIKC
ncbi:hypothetical protein HNP36_000412 [Chryseobacterium shigense]|uniref:Uncharacterized protein n=1 Tax=Chryseobacterium shigense TaxID=297244 RepID=A0A841NDD6_9FLAO|nr:hypothetical protein [Chryseobacterium shigense]